MPTMQLVLVRTAKKGVVLDRHPIRNRSVSCPSFVEEVGRADDSEERQEDSCKTKVPTSTLLSTGYHGGSSILWGY